MPTTVTIRPDATLVNNFWDIVGGATTHGVLSDNNESSNVQTANTFGVVSVGFGNTTLPAGAAVDKIVPRIHGGGSGSNTLHARIDNGRTGAQGQEQTIAVPGAVTWTLPAVTVDPATGSPWDQLGLDYATMTFWMS